MSEFGDLPVLDEAVFGDRKKKRKGGKRAAGRKSLGKRVRLGKVSVPKGLRSAFKYSTRGGTVWAKPRKKSRGRKK